MQRKFSVAYINVYPGSYILWIVYIQRNIRIILICTVWVIHVYNCELIPQIKIYPKYIKYDEKLQEAPQLKLIMNTYNVYRSYSEGNNVKADKQAVNCLKTTRVIQHSCNSYNHILVNEILMMYLAHPLPPFL